MLVKDVDNIAKSLRASAPAKHNIAERCQYVHSVRMVATAVPFDLHPRFFVTCGVSDVELFETVQS